MMGTPNPARAGQLPVPLKQWQEQVNRHMPHLSKPVRAVLCLWSFSIAALQCAGLTTAAVFAANALGCKTDAARQRLREFFREAAAKKGEKRETLDVGACFLPMLRWVLSKLSAGQTRLGIALNATTLADRFTVLAVSVVYQGVAIPVGWTVLTATAKGAWKPHWLNLLERFRGAVPAGLEVFALTDRGLYTEVAVQCHQELELAPVHENQHQRAVHETQQPELASFVRADRAGPVLARQGCVFQRASVGMHAAGVLGCRLQGPVADPDRR